MRSHRLAHYLILLAVAAVSFLPNLGAHALWDMDEGVNTECTREMLEAGTWIVPTFNWELRTAKPIGMYWLQRFSFLAFGVDEWSARLPSVLLGLGTVLLTYELGRRMFDARTGLLAGVALTSSLQFNILSHAATPDAPLIFFVTLALLLFWVGHAESGRGWLIGPAAVCGFAVLCKGPLFLALPWVVVLTYFVWNRELGRVCDWKLIPAGLVFLGIATPWYVYVTTETHGDWLRGFVFDHNVNRFETPMEGHRGPVVFYVVALVVLFAPWSAVLGAALGYAVKAARGESPRTDTPELTSAQRAHRFLLCWFLTFLVFFSLAATKLPNYIGPLYPAVALLTARFLIRWRDGVLNPRRWVMPVGIVGVMVTGQAITLGLLIGSGQFVPLPASARVFPGLEAWAWIGALPVATAATMAWYLWRGDRGGVVQALAAGAVITVALIAAGPPLVIDRYKSPKDLVEASGTCDLDRDIRLASYNYFQESLVFYARRRVQRTVTVEVPNPGGPPQSVERPMTAADAAVFLAMPRPGYLFLSTKGWDEVRPLLTVPVRVAAIDYDFLRHTNVLVVTNEIDPPGRPSPIPQSEGTTTGRR